MKNSAICFTNTRLEHCGNALQTFLINSLQLLATPEGVVHNGLLNFTGYSYETFVLTNLNSSSLFLEITKKGNKFFTGIVVLSDTFFKVREKVEQAMPHTK